MANYWVSLRKEEKLRLLRFLKENKDIPIERALALYSLETGYRLTSLKTFYNELKIAGVVIDEDTDLEKEVKKK